MQTGDPRMPHTTKAPRLAGEAWGYPGAMQLDQAARRRDAAGIPASQSVVEITASSLAAWL